MLTGRRGSRQFGALLLCSGVFLHSLYSCNVTVLHVKGSEQQCYISTRTQERIMISPLSASLHFLWMFVDVTRSSIICSPAARSQLLIQIIYRLSFLFPVPFFFFPPMFNLIQAASFKTPQRWITSIILLQCGAGKPLMLLWQGAAS